MVEEGGTGGIEVGVVDEVGDGEEGVARDGGGGGGW